jgi:hypothetical protein
MQRQGRSVPRSLEEIKKDIGRLLELAHEAFGEEEFSQAKEFCNQAIQMVETLDNKTKKDKEVESLLSEAFFLKEEIKLKDKTEENKMQPRFKVKALKVNKKTGQVTEITSTAELEFSPQLFKALGKDKLKSQQRAEKMLRKELTQYLDNREKHLNGLMFLASSLSLQALHLKQEEQQKEKWQQVFTAFDEHMKHFMPTIRDEEKAKQHEGLVIVKLRDFLTDKQDRFANTQQAQEKNAVIIRILQLIMPGKSFKDLGVLAGCLTSFSMDCIKNQMNHVLFNDAAIEVLKEMQKFPDFKSSELYQKNLIGLSAVANHPNSVVVQRASEVKTVQQQPLVLDPQQQFAAAEECYEFYDYVKTVSHCAAAIKQIEAADKKTQESDEVLKLRCQVLKRQALVQMPFESMRQMNNTEEKIKSSWEDVFHGDGIELSEEKLSMDNLQQREKLLTAELARSPADAVRDAVVTTELACCLLSQAQLQPEEKQQETQQQIVALFKAHLDQFMEICETGESRERHTQYLIKLLGRFLADQKERFGNGKATKVKIHIIIELLPLIYSEKTVVNQILLLGNYVNFAIDCLAANFNHAFFYNTATPLLKQLKADPIYQSSSLRKQIQEGLKFIASHPNTKVTQNAESDSKAKEQKSSSDKTIFTLEELKIAFNHGIYSYHDVIRVVETQDAKYQDDEEIVLHYVRAKVAVLQAELKSPHRSAGPAVLAQHGYAETTSYINDYMTRCKVQSSHVMTTFLFEYSDKIIFDYFANHGQVLANFLCQKLFDIMRAIQKDNPKILDPQLRARETKLVSELKNLAIKVLFKIREVAPNLLPTVIEKSKEFFSEIEMQSVTLATAKKEPANKSIAIANAQPDASLEVKTQTVKADQAAKEAKVAKPKPEKPKPKKLKPKKLKPAEPKKAEPKKVPPVIARPAKQGEAIQEGKAKSVKSDNTPPVAKPKNEAPSAPAGLGKESTPVKPSIADMINDEAARDDRPFEEVGKKKKKSAAPKPDNSTRAVMTSLSREKPAVPVKSQEAKPKPAEAPKKAAETKASQSFTVLQANRGWERPKLKPLVVTSPVANPGNVQQPAVSPAKQPPVKSQSDEPIQEAKNKNKVAETPPLQQPSDNSQVHKQLLELRSQFRELQESQQAQTQKLSEELEKERKANAVLMERMKRDAEFMERVLDEAKKKAEADAKAQPTHQPTHQATHQATQQPSQQVLYFIPLQQPMQQPDYNGGQHFQQYGQQQNGMQMMQQQYQYDPQYEMQMMQQQQMQMQYQMNQQLLLTPANHSTMFNGQQHMQQQSMNQGAQMSNRGKGQHWRGRRHG